MGVYITILCFLPFPFRSASLRRQFFDLLRLLRKIKPATYLPTYLPGSCVCAGSSSHQYVVARLVVKTY